MKNSNGNNNGNRPRRKCTSETQAFMIKKTYAIRGKKQKPEQPRQRPNGQKSPSKPISTVPSKNVQRARQQSRNMPKARTETGKIPQGRTLSTSDKYLPGKDTGSEKERPVVVIEANEANELAVVPLSSSDGNNKTPLPDYQQGQSYFKHFVEIEDDEGEPIVIGEKFRENHPNMDVSRDDVNFIKDTVFNHSKPMQANRKKMDKFRGKKKPQD